MSLISRLNFLKGSFGAQLSSLAITAVVASNLLLLAGVGSTFIHDAKQNQRAEVETVAKLIATALETPMLEANYAEVNDVIGEAVSVGVIGFVKVTLLDGKTLSDVGQIRTDIWASPLIEAQIAYNKNSLGKVTVQLATSPWDHSLGKLFGSLVVSLIFSLGLAHWLFRRFITRTASRIAILKQAAEDFGLGNTQARAVITGDDELADFGRAFDQAMQSITESQANLKDAMHAAEAANIAKSRFLATMSHEIRTPLNGVLGMAELLLMPNLSKEDQQDFVRTILNSGNTLLTILNDILDLSKVEAGRLDLVTSVFSPEQLMRESISLHNGTATGKGLELSTKWQGTEGKHYLGDATRLRQMLGNLLGNAVKFTGHGNILVEGSELPSTTEGFSRLRFSVKDNGIGIPAEKLNMLFLPFSQIDSSDTRRFGGTGLGLSIVRALAEQMGGKVGVSSEAGQGSTFWFEINVGPCKEKHDRRASERPETNTAPTRLETSGRILLVEDNRTNRVVVERLLLKGGFEVIHAEDGQQAIDLFQAEQGRFDVILMDMQMPVMGGLEATQKIRAHEANTLGGRIPIIALTANAFESDRESCIASGMDDFLTKPIKANQLLITVERWLAQHHS
jgi:signal transduction histidine kinase/CheY-like chemotaxis protein